MSLALTFPWVCSFGKHLLEVVGLNLTISGVCVCFLAICYYPCRSVYSNPWLSC